MKMELGKKYKLTRKFIVIQECDIFDSDMFEDAREEDLGYSWDDGIWFKRGGTVILSEPFADDDYDYRVEYVSPKGIKCREPWGIYKENLEDLEMVIKEI